MHELHDLPAGWGVFYHYRRLAPVADVIAHATMHPEALSETEVEERSLFLDPRDEAHGLLLRTLKPEFLTVAVPWRDVHLAWSNRMASSTEEE